MTIETVNMIKIYLLRQSQELSFEEELDCLRKDQNVPAHSKIENFLPFISDDGVIRANRRQKAVALQPQMALLSDLRIPNFENFIFQSTGVDCLGPFAIKASDNFYPKRYACIFTWLTTRAVHLEPAYHLSTDSLIQVILRFTAGRGNPYLLVSDNSRNFIGASRELITKVNQFHHQKISNRLVKETTEWKFIPTYASHFGGAWERLMQSSNQFLYSVIGSQKLTEETFHSFSTQVEILNGRSLTYVSDNGLSYQPITPKHFLIG